MTMAAESLASAAVQYAARWGLAVLPCEPGGKRPLWGLSWEDASTDLEVIQAWWEREPRANIGVACIGDLVVLDVDGAEGEATLARLEAEHGLLPVTREVRTGRGRHIYFRRPEGLTDGWRYGGLELKASGYVLAPPSVHPSGAIYTDAELLEDWEEQPELSAWLLISPRPESERPYELPYRTLEQAEREDRPRLQAAAEAALAGELGKLMLHASDPGSGRHTALYAAAAALGHHVASGGLGRSQVEAVLWAAVPQLGLPQNAEAMHQIRHGLDVGSAEPYLLRERPMEPRTNGYQPPVMQQLTPHLRLRNLTELRMREVQWLWDQRVPLGKLTVLAGLPGQGKSLLTCWLAARASRGELEGGMEGRPVPVLLVSAEDDPEDTIMPRLLRTGGAQELVYVVDVREPGGQTGKDYTRAVNLPGDTPAILRALEVSQAKLIVLDPISGLLGTETDSYKAQHVRQALGPLKAAAEELHAAVVLVTHVLTKAQGTDPLARLADSHAFSGLPRSVLLFGPNPEAEGADRGAGKVLTVAKSNLAGQGEHGLGFTITEGKLVEHAGQLGFSASIRLDGPVATTSQEILATGEDRSALREAMEFLRGELADGPQQAGALIRLAEEHGISDRTLRRAREQVCKRPYKQGLGPWYWALRDPLGHVGQDGHLPQPRPDQEDGQGGQGGQGSQEGGQAGLILQMFPDPDDDPEETPPNG